MAENKIQVKAPEFKTVLAKVSDQYIKMVSDQLSNYQLPLSPYGKECLLHTLSSINNLLTAEGLSFQSPDLDQSTLTTILYQVATLELNAAASPREIYFQIRKKKVGNEWKKKIEMGVEGDGNDAILRKFGLDVVRVGKPWLVRDGDDFTYPTYSGFDVTPPSWQPRGSGKFIRVVYPVKLTDDRTEWLIAEREDVRDNLKAHIKNNLMNETFGIAKNRYDATPDELKKIEVAKREITKNVTGKSLDDLLADPVLAQYISPAWLDSSEQMIVRKMRNNAIKKYPKNFGSAFRSTMYESTDETFARAETEASELGNRVVADITPEPDPEPAPTATVWQNDGQMPPQTVEFRDQTSLDDLRGSQPPF